MPLTVALGTLAVFLFFVRLGSHSSRRGPGQRAPQAKPNTGQPTLFTYQVVQEFDHDARAFTQGLQYEERCDAKGQCRDILWESTGLHGRSSVREVDLATGKVLRSKSLPGSDFGEGVTRLGDKLYQLVWQSGKLWTYDVDDFEKARHTQTPLRDGWGVTSNGTHLIVGDSSDTLFFLDPTTLEVVYEVKVLDGDFPVKWLNELEWIDGLIYANVYQTDCLAQVDPATGGVVGWVQLAGLKRQMMEGAGAGARPDVLNGVAWDGKRARLFVTGKLWPKLYQVELRPLYSDSKATDVAEVTRQVRAECIPAPAASLGRRR